MQFLKAVPSQSAAPPPAAAAAAACQLHALDAASRSVCVVTLFSLAVRTPSAGTARSSSSKQRRSIGSKRDKEPTLFQHRFGNQQHRQLDQQWGPGRRGSSRRKARTFDVNSQGLAATVEGGTAAGGAGRGWCSGAAAAAASKGLARMTSTEVEQVELAVQQQLNQQQEVEEQERWESNACCTFPSKAFSSS